LSTRRKLRLTGEIVKQGATNFELLQQAGDVETNPGPASF
nr:2A [bovine rhinitis B virus 1]